MALTTQASEISDGALLTQLSAGDKAAWDTLVRRHADIVFSVVMRMVRNPADAEDAGQEAFLRIKEYAHTFDAARFGGNARNWIATIACREALKINARKAGSKSVPFDDDMSGGIRDDKADRSGTSKVEENEVQALLREAVQSLPQRQREVIVMHFAAGMTQTEIATELGCDQSTISDRIKQALDKLRHRLSISGASMAVAPTLLAASLTAEVAPQAFVAGLLNHAAWAPAAVAAAKAAKAGAGIGAAKIAAWFGICVAVVAGSVATVHVLKAPAAIVAGDIDVNTFNGWVPNDGTKIAVVAEHAAEGRKALQADFSPSGYPGIKKIFDTPQDWTHYGALRATVYSSADGPIDLSVRVDDDQSTGFGKRFNADGGCRINPGFNEAEISVGALWQGSLLSRGINPARITGIYYFVSGPKKPVTFWFSNIRMVPIRGDASSEIDLVNFDAVQPHVDVSSATLEKAAYTNGKTALKLTMAPHEKYPNFEIHSPTADWLPYDEICIDLTVEGKPPDAGLSLKVADFTGKQQTLNSPIGSGETSWAIPVEMFSHVSLGRVNTFSIFAASNQADSHTLWIRRVTLKRTKLSNGSSRHDSASADDPLTLNFKPIRSRVTANSFQAVVWIPLADGGVRAVRCNSEGLGASSYSVPSSDLDGRDPQKPLRVWAYFSDHDVCYWQYRTLILPNGQSEKILYESTSSIKE